MNPTYFLVYLAAVFSCPVLRCIHYVFEKIHTCIGKKGYVHLCTYLRKYICIDKKGYIVQNRENSPPLYAIYNQALAELES